MKSASPEQSRELIARFSTDTNWGAVHHDPLQSDVIQLSRDELGRRFTAFLNNGCQLVIKGPSALVIDRTRLFDPAKFIGKGSSIWRGSADSNGLEGEEDQDSRSLALTEIDFSKVAFEHFLKEGESSITGEGKLIRMKADPCIRYDAKVGQALFEEKGQATLRWLYDTYGITWFELAGTVLRGSGGGRYFLYLDRDVGGSWNWDYRWLGCGRSAGGVSPVSAS